VNPVDTQIDGIVAPRRTHPLTPLLTGWRVLAGIVAVVSIQNIAQLVEEFSVRRALIALAVLVGVLVLSILVSALSWWRTTYEVDEDGVTLRSGLLTLTRRSAPRDRIDSVSIERPLMPRILHLAKVRVEVAGGSDSHLDIAYVASGDAETLRREILRAAQQAQAPEAGPDSAELHSAGPGTGAPAEAAARSPRSLDVDAVRSFAYDGVTDGEEIATVPTNRLLHSLLRDLGLLIGLAVTIVWAVAVIGADLLFGDEGLSVGALAGLLPALLLAPQMLFRRVESGWGFVARLTERGLRMRRGLLNTRTDAIAPGRIQKIALSQTLLWRGPDWVAARATVAGIGEEIGETNSAGSVLPVGTREELGRTLDCLMTPLGTDDDLAAARALLTSPARSLAGHRAVHPLLWIKHRTQAVVLLPDAIAVRRGIITRSLEIIPRERIQGVFVTQGLLGRALGAADLSIAVAGASVLVEGLPLASIEALASELAVDAACGRRYGEQETWLRPRRGLPQEPAGAVAA